MSKTLRAGAIGALVAGFAAVAMAQAPGRSGNAGAPVKADPSVDPAAAAVEALSMADELAAYGIRSGDVTAIIQAARIKLSVRTSPLKERPKSDVTGPAGDGTKAGGTDLSGDGLLARAEQLAGDNATLRALIEDARAAKGWRGGGPNPRRHLDTVRPHSTDQYTMTFRSQQPAIIAVLGDGNTDLDLYVHDENGTYICSDTDATDRMVCRWNPIWTGEFVIRIANLGDAYNRYEIRTN
jgi:hypothetical protein